MCKSWCQPFNLGAHHYFDFKGHGSWVEFFAASCFVFVCFTTPKVGDYFVFKSHKWVRFSFFLFFCLFVCLFCFVLFFLQSVRFPHYILGSGWFFFFFFFFFVSQVGKVFCFLSFLFVFILFCFGLFFFCFVLFCFVLFCFLFFFWLPKIPPPLISNGAPYPYSITQMMVDITSSTILDSRAIQWKI